MNISLRSVRLTDSEIIYKWKNDLFIKEMALDYDYKTTLLEQETDISNSISNKHSDYQIIVLNNVLPIGYIRIDWMDNLHKIAWLRFALGTERGKGYSIIALRSFLANLIENGCLRIEGEVYDFNVASKNVLEKLGFVKEGNKRKAHFNGDKFSDIHVYGLLAHELKDEFR